MVKLTPEQIADGWIAWDAPERGYSMEPPQPDLPPNTRVLIMFADGHCEVDQRAREFERYAWWLLRGVAIFSIGAYKVVE